MKELVLDPKNLTFRLNTVYNYYEAVDCVSGEVVAVQNDLNENVLLGKMDDLIKAEVDGRTIYFQKGISIESYKVPSLKFSRPLGDLIIQEIMEGKSPKKACKKYGIQFSTMMKWTLSNPEFGEAYNLALKARAEEEHEKLLDIAEDLEKGGMSKTDVEATKVAAEIRKWSAEKSDPQRYGGKIEKGQQGAVQIIINTGISRDVPEPVTVEVEHVKSE